MAEKRKLEFFLLRYVPDAVKGEFVNIGLVMIEAQKVDGSFTDVRFTKDWRRVQCLDPDADVDLLRAMEADIRRRVVEVRSCEEVMRILNDSFSNAIQLSGAQGCVTEDPTKEIEEMVRIYLESARASTRALSSREKIVDAMDEAWEAAGVSAFMKPFPIARYTDPGDSFKFDFGYVLGRQVKLFHAVSLKARVDSAVNLAARYPKIAQAMKSAERLPLTPVLTAVVDNELEKAKDEIRFALAMMEESAIAVSEMRDMPRIAEAVRRELGV